MKKSIPIKVLTRVNYKLEDFYIGSVITTDILTLETFALDKTKSKLEKEKSIEFIGDDNNIFNCKVYKIQWINK